MSAVPVAERAPRESAASRTWAFARHHALTVYALLAFAYLMLPIGIVIAFSFNEPQGRFNYVWSGFTFEFFSASLSPRAHSFTTPSDPALASCSESGLTARL